MLKGLLLCLGHFKMIMCRKETITTYTILGVFLIHILHTLINIHQIYLPATQHIHYSLFITSYSNCLGTCDVQGVMTGYTFSLHKCFLT